MTATLTDLSLPEETYIAQRARHLGTLFTREEKITLAVTKLQPTLETEEPNSIIRAGKAVEVFQKAVAELARTEYEIKGQYDSDKYVIRVALLKARDAGGPNRAEVQAQIDNPATNVVSLDAYRR